MRGGPVQTEVSQLVPERDLDAAALAKTLRERDSMYMQALAVATRVFGEEGTEAIEKVFEVHTNIPNV